MSEGRLWGGRFSAEPAEVFEQFANSFGFDRRLLPYELQVDRAWAEALVQAGVLSESEGAQIRTALDDIDRQAQSDADSLERAEAEDVHSFVEAELVRRIGALGTKLHTGRSRNELIATDLRLFVKEAARATGRGVGELVQTLGRLAERSSEIPLAGQTHLQPAQPLLLAHYFLAQAEAFLRDLERLRQAFEQADACPLGSGALAGTSLPIDRQALARRLGFSRVTANSLDAVGDRDFILDYLFAASAVAIHLSRLATDMILWATPEFGWFVLPERFTTGSSLMPQKKNPDAWELIRGSSGRVVGSLTALLLMLKGLPSSYHRDLQEDKPPLFEAHDRILASVRVATAALAETGWEEQRLRASAANPTLLATAAAEELAARGVPFRQAHQAVGRLIREAERRGSSWTELPEEVYRSIVPALDPDWLRQLTVEAVLARYEAIGGTAPAAVRAAARALPERLQRSLSWCAA